MASRIQRSSRLVGPGLVIERLESAAGALRERARGGVLLLAAPILLLPGVGTPVDLLGLGAVLIATLLLEEGGRGLGLALKCPSGGRNLMARPPLAAPLGLLLLVLLHPVLLLPGGVLLLLETLRRAAPPALSPLAPLVVFALAALRLDVLLVALDLSPSGTLVLLAGLLAALAALGEETTRSARLAKDDPRHRFTNGRLALDAAFGTATALAMALYLVLMTSGTAVAQAGDAAFLTAPPVLLALLRHWQLVQQPVRSRLRPGPLLADGTLVGLLVAWALLATLVFEVLPAGL